MRFIILLLLVTLTSISVSASKAVRFFRDITLNDGRIVSATLVGDENLHFYKTQDGEIVLYNSEGNYYYAASKEQIDSLNAIADQQQQQASITTLKKKGLILVGKCHIPTQWETGLLCAGARAVRCKTHGGANYVMDMRCL